MTAALHLLAAALLPLPAWWWLRRGARVSAWMLLDGAPLAAAFCALLAVTARPVLAGGLVGCACIFLAVADRAKRAALREPLAFTDGGLLWQVPAHPRFYLPFVPRAVVVGGIGAGVAAFLAVLALEPALALGWSWRMVLAIIAAALVGVVLRPLWLLRGAVNTDETRDTSRTQSLARDPSRDRALARDPTRDQALARDPTRDAARFGPLAAFALHARTAAVERVARRAAYPPAPAVAAPHGTPPHLVLLQLESFCDPRRLGLPQALPHWDALASSAVARGRLAVPGFGANTMRTEFVVLTGLDDAALGLDRFNPYFRFARTPVASLAWALSGAGWSTACLHPYDGRFFGRDRVLPALGFQRFADAAAFADAPREHGLVTDAALGARIVAELEAAAAPLFLYAITVAAHGPWPGADPAAGWAARMAATDAMLGAVANAARRSARPVVLAAFGDHRPSLPVARGATDTDYLIWRSDTPGGGAARDLDAAALHRAVRTAVGVA
ncbi:sulfatase-like hydrolase/transferase [Roseomonas fluvialis]|uniref:Capsular polysaccharide biosynthesis protein n=1 Tax=Roseomonas fluvialis TaxID=1750527 RepID=A0ABN6P5J3_9PROT|nr:sulfatase-like hydrolase/transferase [Roseomonas fluvialis]BDG73937.1 capsular polysaccharide biosynthesis protein [Roseomonas fluvialis]